MREVESVAAFLIPEAQRAAATMHGQEAISVHMPMQT